jgi:anion-transporting  ArsA/GET3 family ATPase
MTSIFERRLIVVTGKGGTGKTTVAACLALAASQQGLRVAVAETGRDEQLANLFGERTPAGYPGREFRPGLHVLRLDPFEALSEYLELELPLPGIGRRLLANPSFRSWLEAVPGWRELITLGKLWHLEQQTVSGRPRFDCIVVDAPATGHGLTFLDVPRVAVSAVRGGPLRRHAAAVEALVLDPERTVVLPISLAEELPVSETCELVDRLREERGLSVDRVVVNGLEPEGQMDLSELAAHLEALPAELDGAPSPHAIAACAHHVRQRVEGQSAQHLRLKQALGLPTVALPRLPRGVSGPEDLAQLSRALLPGVQA